MLSQMFVSGTPMQQDRRVMALPSPRVARPFAAVFLSLFLLFAMTTGPASAAAPVDVNSQITDKAGVLGADEAKVSAALKQFTQKTGFQLFVVYVKDFDGMTGTEWARATASKSALGTTDILLAVSTSNNDYGLAEPGAHGVSEKEFSAVLMNDVRPAVNTGDWAGAAIGAARGYQLATENSGLPWSYIVLGIVLVILTAALITHRLRRTYDETHVIHDEHGRTVDPLELLDTDELIDKAQFCVAAVDDPELKSRLALQLSDLLSTDRKRTDDTRRKLAMDIVHHSKKLDRSSTAGAPDAARARP